MLCNKSFFKEATFYMLYSTTSEYANWKTLDTVEIITVLVIFKEKLFVR